VFEKILAFLKSDKVILFIFGYAISTICPIPLLGLVLGVVIGFIQEIYNSFYSLNCIADGMTFGIITMGSIVGYLIILMHLFI
jgi:hypothetical protein